MSTFDAAISALQTTRFDAVVLKMRLLDADGRTGSGLELLSFLRLHDHLQHMPAMILAGIVLTTEEEHAIADLQAYVIQKPDKPEGRQTVRQYLHHRTAAGSAARLTPRP